MSCARLAFVPSFPPARSLAISCMVLAGAAAAQGVAPPAAGGEKPFGGFEPVLHLRTYYFDQESLTGVPASAWALGGWAGVRSPWWGDMFQLGVVGYTSLKLYGPDDKDGTRLLAPGQETIAIIGEAFGAVRILGQTFTGYRQRINRPFINLQDNRMVPNTFEAYTLTGAASDVSYTGGYITKMKKRDSEHFVWMSDAAGGSNGDHKGTAFAGATWDFVKNGYVRADFQETADVFRHVLCRRQVSDRPRRADRAGARRAIHPPEVGRRRADRQLLDLGRGAAGDDRTRAVRGSAVLHADGQGVRHPEPVRRPPVVPRT